MSEDPATEDPATAGAPAEYRTVHVHRHRRRRRFVAESESLARHREDLRALSWILPLCLLGLGAILLFLVTRNPEPATRPAGLVETAWALLGAGAVWLAVGLAGSWIAAVRRWSRDQEDSSGHRRHHHHHHHRAEG